MTKSKKMIIGTLPFVALIVLFAIFLRDCKQQRVSSGYVH